MGDPKKIKKKYSTPRHPFERDRIDRELKLVGKYGLRNMHSIWKHSTMLRTIRGNVRHLLSLPADDEHRQKQEQAILARLQRLGFIEEGATLDDVLSLKIDVVLNRRLQTLVHKKGMAVTPHHARQMVTHGHIVIGERVRKSPSYLVPVEEENMINYASNSPYNNPKHVSLPEQVQERAQEHRASQRKKRGRRRGRRSRRK